MGERFSTKTVDFTFVMLRCRTKGIVQWLIIFAQHLAVEIALKKNLTSDFLIYKNDERWFAH